MHISKVGLENIKSHASSTFEFAKGTTAITGENGAGKTTIIEAIAWVLFDLLEYKKEDFVRRGEKRGSVTVTFESGLDEREYVVYRDTGTGYHVTDPRLGVRIAVKKEEVFRFLWQHLGLEPGTDLKSLFRQAIGVPQGTFTAIFLEGSTDRKIAFDRLLKVEEYRQAAEKLRETSRFLDNSVRDIRETIARAEGELSRSETVEAEHRNTGESIAELNKSNERIASYLSSRQKTVADLDTKAQNVGSIKNSMDRFRSESEKTRIVQRQAEQALAAAEQAALIVQQSRAAHDRHTAALGRLKELERERVQRDGFRTELAKVDAALVSVTCDQKRFNQELEVVKKAASGIETLRPLVADQDVLDAEINRLRSVVAEAKSADAHLISLRERRDALRDSYKANLAALQTADEKALIAAELSALEIRSGELMKSLAALQASLERDEKFQSEIRNGLCPILSQKCLNLAEGETLEGFVSSQFGELRLRIGTVETERTAVSEKLAVAREAAKAAAAVDSLGKRKDELTREGTAINAEIELLEQKTAGLATAQHQLADSEMKLKTLDDPRGRIRLLEQQVVRTIDIRTALSDIESNLERLDSERKTLDEQLEDFKSLDEKWSEATAARDETADAYKLFVVNEREAALLDKRRTESESAENAMTQLAAKLGEAKKEFTAISQGYDSELHNSERASLLEAERRYAETQARVDTANTRYQQLAAELERFSELRKSLAVEFRQKERLEDVAETTAFIRDTLKEAAPRVARNYVYHVSLEANQMFREITGNAEQTLKWAEDYSIVLEEEGYERPFVSLSGGEQMSAALAVRLALLKQLSDIRIAFFDEPTTNMDAERRENFAAQIRRITHFDQLFVISHDDTFEEYVDRTLHIGK